MRRSLLIILSLLVVVSVPTLASGPVNSTTTSGGADDAYLNNVSGSIAGMSGIPDPIMSEVSTAATEPIVLYTTPGGNGHRLNQAFALGPVVVDATITVILRDGFGDPVPGFPAEDIWLEPSSGGSLLCTDGSIADGDTDLDGVTTFSGPIASGGTPTTESDGVLTVINGQPIPSSILPIRFVSSDIVGVDKVVNLSDVHLFTQDFFLSPTESRSDYYWDGVVDISDAVLFAHGLQAECGSVPGPTMRLPGTDPLPPATIGAYFDPEGTQQTITAQVGEVIEVYILMFVEETVEMGAVLYSLDSGSLVMVHEDTNGNLVMNGPVGSTTCQVHYCTEIIAGEPLRISRVELLVTSAEQTAFAVTDGGGAWPPAYADCGGLKALNVTAAAPAYVNPCYLPPEALELDYTAAGNHLDWEAFSGTVCTPTFNIYRDVSPGSAVKSGTLIYSTTDTEWFDSGGTVAHIYRVTASDGGVNESEPVSPVLIVPPVMNPEPDHVQGTSNLVSWGVGGPEYLVQCSVDPAFAAGVVESGWIAADQFQFSGLADGQEHHFRVKSRNTELESDWSAVVSSTQDDSAPESSVDPLPTVFNELQIGIPYTATDAASGVAGVDLYYRSTGIKTASYGWEDGLGTILGYSGEGFPPIIATNTDANGFQGNRSLQLEYNADLGAPKAYLLWIRGLQDGDIVTAGFWRYDDTPAADPGCRIFGFWNDDPGDIDAYFGSASGNLDFGPGSGWDYVEHSWSVVGGHTGLVIYARVYAELGQTVWIDDLQVSAPGPASVMMPDGSLLAEDEYIRYGTFTGSPIGFTAPDFGNYEFYTVAADNVGNVEAVPASPPDAQTLISDVASAPDGLPPVRAVALRSAYPNPFNPSTTLRFELPERLPVRLEIFDVSGRLVRVLEKGRVRESGRHEVVWNGRGDRGTTVAAGLYFCRLKAGEVVKTIRMTLVK